MKRESIDDLKEYLSMGKSLKVCILDNNSVEFLTRVNEIVGPDKIFNQYDMILVPRWVWFEICNSDVRENYVNNLKSYSKLQIIDEIHYSELVNYREAELYYLFLYSCYNVSRIVSFIKKNILNKGKVEDIDPYEEWLNMLYYEGLDKKESKDGKILRKNAGEISISVLSYIISYYYEKNVEVITVFSNDRDAYEFISKAKEMLNKHEVFKNRNSTPITFKSNDFLIYEWTRNKFIDETNIDDFVTNHRQLRKIKFTRKKQDNSIEEQDKLIDNETFLKMLKDSTLHIIF